MIRAIIALLYLFLATAALAQSPAPVQLTWTHSTDNVAVTGYNIYRDGKKIGTTPTTAYTDTTVAPTTQYSYTVSAFDAAGNESDTSTPYVIKTGTIIILPGDTDHPFTPLHLYYIDTVSGNDANPGTFASPWAGPNHSVVCGDVLLVKGNTSMPSFVPGTSNTFGTVSNCPSTTGGIDGTGGIYFAILLCAGPDMMSCKINGGAFEAVRIDVSNWSVQGFWGTQNKDGSTGCFTAEQDNAVRRYAAFINDIASVCDAAGFASSGGGCGSGQGNCGFDQMATVGIVAFDAANSLTNFGLCGSGISLIPTNPDATPGTHIYTSQYFGSNNSNRLIGGNECAPIGNVAAGYPHTDGEGIIFDSYANGAASPGAWNKPAVLENSVIWKSGNNCVQVFPTGNGTTNDQGQYYVNNITCYSNVQDPRAACGGGSEAWLHAIYPTSLASYRFNNSIFYGTQTSCGGAGIFSIDGVFLMTDNSTSHLQFDATRIDVSNNWIWNSAGTTTTTVGPTNTYVVDGTTTTSTPPCSVAGPPCFNATWHFGTNTYNNSGMTNPSALFNTAPDCTAFTNVVTCMLNAYQVYNNVIPTIAPKTMGYQPPGPCGPNANYPTWLKGVVYLQSNGYVNGATITEKAGLATKPCNM